MIILSQGSIDLGWRRRNTVLQGLTRDHHGSSWNGDFGTTCTSMYVSPFWLACRPWSLCSTRRTLAAWAWAWLIKSSTVWSSQQMILNGHSSGITPLSILNQTFRTGTGRGGSGWRSTESRGQKGAHAPELWLSVVHPLTRASPPFCLTSYSGLPRINWTTVECMRWNSTTTSGSRTRTSVTGG